MPLTNTNKSRLMFNHEWASILFRSDKPDIVLLDKCKYHLKTNFRYREGDFLVEAEDLERIFSPDLRVDRRGDRIVVSFDPYLRYIPGLKRIIEDGCGFWESVASENVEMRLGERKIQTSAGNQEIAVAPESEGDNVYIPVGALFGAGFATIINRHDVLGNTFWKKKLEPRQYLCISFNEKAFQFSPRWIETEIEPLYKKNWGNVYETIWFEEGRRLMPYRLYVPYSYDSENPNKAVLLFHGGGTNENVYFDDSKNQLQFYAEKYGYLLIAPTSYSVSTFFGSMIPILQTIDGIDPNTADPQNPENWPPFTIELRAMANRAVWTELDYIFEHWNIDRGNLFGQGNSAGSNALTYFALTYPGLMKAIIPGAGWVNPNFADMSLLKNTPIMHLIGSEDHFGVDYIKPIYDLCDELGLDCTRVIVGGGTHFNAWTRIIDKMFEFYEAHLS